MARKILFWLHLIAGTLVAAVVLVMSFTGVLLTYQKQITTWADLKDARIVAPAPGAKRLPLDALLLGIAGEGGKPSSVTWRSEANAPVEVSLGEGRRVFVDPYSGAVTGRGSASVRAKFQSITAWHRWLGAKGENRKTAKAVTGAANFAFLFLVISGFFLWWPKTWTWARFRNVLFFRRGLSSKARDFNWHHVIGIWSLVPLFVIVLSGVVISYRWAGNLVYRVMGEEPPQARAEAPPARAALARAETPQERARPAIARTVSRARPETSAVPLLTRSVSIEEMLSVAQSRVPEWRRITLQIPSSPSAPVTFAIDAGTGGEPHKRSQLKLARDGSVTEYTTFASGTTGRRARTILRFAHTGELGGVAGQTLAGLLSLGATVLVWTGLALSTRRLLAWFRRRRSSAPRTTSAPSPGANPIPAVRLPVRPSSRVARESRMR
jgi:uncharacterized iron-regulated membrane protein